MDKILYLSRKGFKRNWFYFFLNLTAQWLINYKMKNDT